MLGVLAVAGWREHWPAAIFGSSAQPALSWSAAQAPLPADAVRTASSYAGLDDVACSGSQSCVAVGYYDRNGTSSSSSSQAGLVETLNQGIWTPSVPAIDVPGQDSSVVLIADTCPAAGSCVAVGNSSNSQGIAKPLIQMLAANTWTPASVPLPADADQAKAASLSSVACPAQGSCVATGWYTDANGDTQALIETSSNGAWTATTAPLPAGAGPVGNNTTLPTGIWVVTCTAVGSCEAVGDYQDHNGDYQALIETLSGGTWTPARAPLPSDAAANPAAYLFGVDCPQGGTCVAVGHYNNGSGQSRNLIESLSGGVWVPSAGPFPAGAPASQKWSVSALPGLDAVACQAVGSCVAPGTYIGQGSVTEGMIDTLSDGTWSAARAPLPAGAGAAKAGSLYFGAAICPASGDCLAVGGYQARNGSSQGLIETARPKSS